MPPTEKTTMHALRAYVSFVFISNYIILEWFQDRTVIIFLSVLVIFGFTR